MASREDWEDAVTAKLLGIGTQLEEVKKQLGVVSKIPDLVENALKAVATESRNAADIKDLGHRVALLEAQLEKLQPPLAS